MPDRRLALARIPHQKQALLQLNIHLRVSRLHQVLQIVCQHWLVVILVNCLCHFVEIIVWQINQYNIRYWILCIIIIQFLIEQFFLKMHENQ